MRTPWKVSGCLLWAAATSLLPATLRAADAHAVGGVGTVVLAGDEGGPLEKGAYLGVAATTVDETLGSQLGLPAGVGLRLEYVDPASPAHGTLQRHDVLHKLDDQLLVNQPQLAVLARSRQPGDTVALTILRGGKAQTF